MTRVARQAPGGTVFHVLNRGVGKRLLFENDTDDQAFERVLEQILEVQPASLCLLLDANTLTSTVAPQAPRARSAEKYAKLSSYA